MNGRKVQSFECIFAVHFRQFLFVVVVVVAVVVVVVIFVLLNEVAWATLTEFRLTRPIFWFEFAANFHHRGNLSDQS